MAMLSLWSCKDLAQRLSPSELAVALHVASTEMLRGRVERLKRGLPVLEERLVRFARQVDDCGPEAVHLRHPRRPRARLVCPKYCRHTMPACTRHQVEQTTKLQKLWHDVRSNMYLPTFRGKVSATLTLAATHDDHVMSGVIARMAETLRIPVRLGAPAAPRGTPRPAGGRRSCPPLGHQSRSPPSRRLPPSSCPAQQQQAPEY